MKYKLIEIIWEDTCASPEKWYLLKDIDFEDLEKQLLHKTVGYFLKKTEQSITVARSMEINEKENPIIDGVITIPRSCIKRVRIIK